MTIDLTREGFEAFLKDHIAQHPNNAQFALSSDDWRCPIATWIVNQGFTSVWVNTLQIRYTDPETDQIVQINNTYPWIWDYITRVDNLDDRPKWITAEEALAVLERIPA